MEKQQESLQKLDNETEEDNNAYSLFLYGVRSPVTRDYYLRRLRIFFNYIKLLPDETMEKRCNFFAVYAQKNPNLVFRNIIEFLQFQRERAKEIRKLYKQTILDTVYIVRSLIPNEVLDDFHDARKDYMKGK